MHAVRERAADLRSIVSRTVSPVVSDSHVTSRSVPGWAPLTVESATTTKQPAPQRPVTRLRDTLRTPPTV